jgi:uncharacterized Zn-binding protein involved in type VI secretion
MNKLDFQLGKVKKINEDGTLNIQDFRTGGQVYTNIAVEHNAINQQQPVEGQHVLFFTADDPNQQLIKVVRTYGSNNADKQLVVSSPQDMDQGEGRMISQTGATVYVANGGLFLYSGGQSFMLLDEDQLTELICQNLDIVTRDGFEIKKGTDGKLTIQKGTFKVIGDTHTVENPTATITVQDNNVKIEGKSASLELDLTSGKVLIHGVSVELNGTTPVARQNDSCGYLYFSPGLAVAPAPGVPNTCTLTYSPVKVPVVPVTIPPTIEIPVKIVSGSLTVKAG